MTGEERGRSLPTPNLTWESGHTPCAARFGDIYYSREGGLMESRHVFLGGNDLPLAWRDRQTFVICELGFGTGLNFLAAWELWRRTRATGARLHYIAVEGFPLTRRELGECLTPWDELKELADGLRDTYPEPQRGYHRVFPNAKESDARGDVSLTLLYGDASAMLEQLEAEVDAWFLDGFAPDKNPEMWSEAVFAQMARLSRAGATGATYSVAGGVRRGLQSAGFDVSRAKGFGAKREMLRLRLSDGRPRTSTLQPWFAQAPHRERGHAAIIGAGLAGAHTAAALGRRGWTTTVIDRAERVAAGGSGAPRAVMAPRLTVAPALDGRYYAAAWRFALAERKERAGFQSGVLQLAADGDDLRFAEIAARGVLPAPLLAHVDAKEASDIAGVALPAGGLFFPRGGWLEPRELCAALMVDSEVRLGVTAAALSYTHGLWRILDGTGQAVAEADAVVLANATGMTNVSAAAWLPLEARRGQITLAPTNARAAALRTVLLYGGFLTPAERGFHAVGATFDMEAGIDIRAGDHVRNLESLGQVLPGLLPLTDGLEGFAAVRCMSPDHLPIVGPLPEHANFLSDFADLRHGHPWARYPTARYHHGLYAMTGLGARGLVSAPLAAEVLACHITGEPWPLERDLVAALHPARFLVRELKRREA